MHVKSKLVALILAVLLETYFPFGHGLSGQLEQANVTTASARGGALVRSASYQFEVFCYKTGLRIFVFDPAGSAISASLLKGTVDFYHPNSPRPWFTRPLHPAPAQPGHPSESLDLAMDLSTVPTSGVTVTIVIDGLPGPKAPTARFSLRFAPVEMPTTSSDAGQVVIPAQAVTVPTTQVYHFATPGLYRTASDALIWVPTPGYYYDAPVQYYPNPQSTLSSGWQPAHPAPEPTRVIVTRGSGAPDTIQSEYYWRPRAWGNTEAYQAWLRGQMRLEQAAGRSPSNFGRDCARCHKR